MLIYDYFQQIKENRVTVDCERGKDTVTLKNHTE